MKIGLYTLKSEQGTRTVVSLLSISTSTMQKLMPCLWYNTNAEEAVGLYSTLFPNSAATYKDYFNKEGAQASGQPEGSLMSCVFTLAGQEFMALNGGTYYQFSPAISLFVSCETEEELNTLWTGLADGATIMMPLDSYPFSKKYGWLQDKFGLSWQLILGTSSQKIAPCFLFTGKVHGRAEEAIQYYTSIFKNSSVDLLEKYQAGDPDPAIGTIKHASFTIDGYICKAMDSSFDHKFGFTGGISHIVNCNTQEEIDYFYNSLLEGGEEQQCGWVTDKFGIMWQIIPSKMNTYMSNPATAQKVMHEMLQMKKLDMSILERAYRGE